MQEPVALQDGHFCGPAGGHHVSIPGGCVIQVCQDSQGVGTPSCVLCKLRSHVSPSSSDFDMVRKCCWQACRRPSLSQSPSGML